VKRGFIFVIALLLLLTSCNGQEPGDTSSAPSSDVSSGPPSDAPASVINMGEPLTTDPVTPLTVDGNGTGSTSIIVGKNALRREQVRLPEFEQMTTDMIMDAVYNDDAVRVSMVKEREFLASDAVAALKIKCYGGKYGQFISMRGLDQTSPDGANEEVVHDPVPDTLEAYEGIRFWLNIVPNTENKPGFEVVFFMGTLANGDNNTKYRSMYECKVTVPPGGYRGYVEFPFEEFTNYYNGQKAVNKRAVDYFAVKLTADNENIAGVDVYVSGFQAYRDIFW